MRGGVSARVLRCSAAALCFAGGGLAAQQQTGAPAGIPVPPVPLERSSSAPAPDGGALHYRVRVVDGRNGLPVGNAHVRIWYDEPAGTGYQVATDAAGYGNMPAPATDPLRILAEPLDAIDCRKPVPGDPPQGYNMEAIARGGLAAKNGCGAVAVHLHPGELVLYVRPARWYEGLNRGITH